MLGDRKSQTKECKPSTCQPTIKKLKKASTYYFAGLRPITTGAQTFFGTEACLSYTLKNKHLTTITLTIIILNTINSALFNAMTRSYKMIFNVNNHSTEVTTINDSDALESKTTNDEDLSIIETNPHHMPLSKKIRYGIGVFSGQGSKLFSSLSAYNAIFFVFKTWVDYTQSGDPMEYINEHHTEQAFIELFSMACFMSQFMSYSSFQMETIRKYLINFWLNSEERKRKLASLGKVNLLVWLGFLAFMLSSTALSMYSTQKGLEHINESLTKPILDFNIPEEAINIIVWLSAFCMMSTITINSIPSTIDYIIHSKENTHKEITTAGKIAKVMGIIDNLATTYSTIFASILALSNILSHDVGGKSIKVDPYNPILIGTVTLLIGLPTFIFNYVYNTFVIIDEIYQVPKRNEQLTDLDIPLLEKEPRPRSSSPRASLS